VPFAALTLASVARRQSIAAEEAGLLVPPAPFVRALRLHVAPLLPGGVERVGAHVRAGAARARPRVVLPAANATAVRRLANAVHFQHEDWSGVIALLLLAVAVLVPLVPAVLAGRPPGVPVRESFPSPSRTVVAAAGFRLGPLSFAFLLAAGSRSSARPVAARPRCCAVAGLERGSRRLDPDRRAHGRRPAASREPRPARRRARVPGRRLWPHLTALQHLTFAAPGLSPLAARELLERAAWVPMQTTDRRGCPAARRSASGCCRALAPEPSVLRSTNRCARSTCTSATRWSCSCARSPTNAP
jgi:hypothetical protein